MRGWWASGKGVIVCGELGWWLEKLEINQLEK